MKLPFLSKNKEEARRNTWQWASCKQPKTFSFRAGDDVFKTVNSVFLDLNSNNGVETLDSWFTNSSESASFSTQSEDHVSKLGSTDEVIIRGAQSDRLFFEPDVTRSILKEKKASEVSFKESVVLAMESQDPYEDFKRSMEEMVESHGLKDWECLEELLGCYLRVNGKRNHGFIVGAFVDLLLAMASPSSPSSSSSNSHSCDSTSFSSADTSFSSPSSPLSPLGKEKEIVEEDNTVILS